MNTSPVSHMKWDASRNLVARYRLLFLVIVLMTIWSIIFSWTFTRQFEWDDLHMVRQYSLSELLSTFHGPFDTDHLETPALRPVITVFFDLQTTLFGEHMILQRLLAVALMCGFLWAVALLLREVGLSFRHIIIVLILYVASRFCSSLVLFIAAGSMLLAYLFMTLTALFYVRWTKSGRPHFIVLTIIFATVAAFSREESYALPLVLPFIWRLSNSGRANYQRAVIGALVVTAVMATHYALRATFIVDAPQPGLHFANLVNLRMSVITAWFPGGRNTVGFIDNSLKWGWIAFLCFLAAMFVCFSSNRQHKLVFGICVLGIILCTPSLAALRSFGVTLGALSFFTAISVVVVDLWGGVLSRQYVQENWRTPVLCICCAGLTVGITAGILRSLYVAQALDPNSVEMVVSDAVYLFDNHATIPEARRQAVAAHLAQLGFHSREDMAELIQQFYSGRHVAVKPPMFMEKYEYWSF